MKRAIQILATAATAVAATAGAARAQISAPPAAETKGYAEAVAQSAFGNVTSQSFGLEAGYALRPRASVFAEIGKVRDAAPATLGASAQLIAGFLAQSQSGVGYGVKQPVTFGLLGVRYAVPVDNAPRVEPYVMAGGGLARVKRDVQFSVSGADVTTSLNQLGVVLGTDLSGSETRGMFTLGAGVVWPAWRQLIVDFQYRYGRVLASDAAFNVNRAGIGIGARF